MTTLSLPAGLRDELAERGITLARVAKEIQMDRGALSRLINRGIWPARDAQAIHARLMTWLKSHDIGTQEKAPQRGRAAGRGVSTTQNEEETTDMLLRKQALLPETRQHFGLNRDPLVECREPADVFLTPDARYVREAMWSTVRHGGFLAVVGESGSGKTTLREELLERIQRDEPSIITCEPYVLAMEDTDTVGKTLRSHHIAECILHAVAPLARPRRSPDARFRQLHEALRESARSGMRHTLLIEEAHCLPIPTLKHLKRYLELKDGMRPLLSILLIGQPELAMKLDERNPRVREVAQRCEIVHLPPLDQNLKPYLKHRFGRVGADVEAVLTDCGLEALRTRLTPRGANVRGSLLYPLAVHNALAAAMNAAAALGVPRVTGDVVRGGVA